MAGQRKKKEYFNFGTGGDMDLGTSSSSYESDEVAAPPPKRKPRPRRSKKPIPKDESSEDDFGSSSSSDWAPPPKATPGVKKTTKLNLIKNPQFSKKTTEAKPTPEVEKEKPERPEHPFPGFQLTREQTLEASRARFELAYKIKVLEQQVRSDITKDEKDQFKKDLDEAILIAQYGKLHLSTDEESDPEDTGVFPEDFLTEDLMTMMQTQLDKHRQTQTRTAPRNKPVNTLSPGSIPIWSTSYRSPLIDRAAYDWFTLQEHESVAPATKGYSTGGMFLRFPWLRPGVQVPLKDQLYFAVVRVNERDDIRAEIAWQRFCRKQTESCLPQPTHWTVQHLIDAGFDEYVIKPSKSTPQKRFYGEDVQVVMTMWKEGNLDLFIEHLDELILLKKQPSSSSDPLWLTKWREVESSGDWHEILEFTLEYIRQKELGTVPALRKEEKTTEPVSLAVAAGDKKKGEGELNPAVSDERKELVDTEATASTSFDVDSSNSSRYPKRSMSKKYYVEEELPPLDHTLLCDDCNVEYEGDCPVHGPLTHMPDTVVHEAEVDKGRMTLPKFLAICLSKIKGAMHGVCSMTDIPKRAVFGPYVGRQLSKANADGYCFQMRRSQVPVWIDASDMTRSNWMRYVNCARDATEQNLVSFQYKGNIYFKSTKEIKAKSELLVYYGDEYARKLGIDVHNYHKPGYRAPDTNNNNGNGYMCGICCIGFTSHSMYVKHCRVKHGQLVETLVEHEGVTTTQCKYCLKTFTTKHSLKLHIGSVHAGTKYRCVECNKDFTRASYLQAHREVHSEGTVPCELCAKTFPSLLSRKNHIRHVHSSVRYSCEVCNKQFKQLSSLKTHSRVHTGEKPYLCQYCPYAATRNIQLQDHIRLHHQHQ